MKLNLSTVYNENLDLIVSVAEGLVTTENIRDTIFAANLLSKKKSCPFVLFDIRKCQVHRSYLEGFLDMKVFGERVGLLPEIRYAVLFNPQIFPAERAHFIETVTTNRFVNSYRMFSDEVESLKWLKNIKATDLT